MLKFFAALLFAVTAMAQAQDYTLHT
ncbi:phospholipase, partial [Pseudomonas syringae pv. actinidifoliorum]|nr:phospholipase [Pseudomonas syringae pv. actinidifoliorum]